jgi:hypothetical protein
MIKIVSLFLIVILGLAMFGRLRIGGGPKRRTGTGKCPKCGRYRIGRGPCPCGNKKA